MIVCIAEKPSVAGEIAKILGATTRRDGYFEGNNYQVTWTYGHFCTLKEPHDYKAELKRWHLGFLPIIPSHFGIKLISNQGVEKQFNIIKSLVTKADEIINCGDAGQEGELIQRWVLQKAGTKSPVKRLWISSLTEEAIREGFQHLKESKEFDNLYAAGSARAIGDWLLGINATRLYTLKYGQKGQVLSIGRVQTPTLALIVNRQKEIDNFVSEPFWELKTKFKEVLFSASKGRFLKKEEAESALEKIKEKEFEVVDFSRKKGKEAPPRLFDLTSLQVEGNKKFAFSADDTLKIIQTLYEKKLTTYPRVDTTFLSNDIYPKIHGILKGLKSYATLTEPLLQASIKKSKKVFDDKKVTDHHAIIPTGVAPGNLSRNEQLIYDIVTRRFIAAFYPDSVISTTQVLGKVEDVDFKATGKQIVEPGWRVVFPKTGNSTKEESIMPEFTKGEKGRHEPELTEKETQPPKLYTEATLLRAMESAGKQVDDEELRDLMKENGIGRPSTRAAIIETLFRRKYILKERKNIIPPITGVQLIDTIRNDMLKSAELTGMWEKKLREIERGKYDIGEFMKELKQMVSDVVFNVKRDNSFRVIQSVTEEEKKKPARKKSAKPVELTCPRCGKGKMLAGHNAWGCSEYKSGCKTVIPFSFEGKKIPQKQFEKLIKTGKTDVLKGFETSLSQSEGESSPEKIKVDGFITLDDNYKLILNIKEKERRTCPVCGKGEIVKGHSAYGCTNFRNGCNFRIPFEIYGKKLTESQIESLILKKQTPTIKGFIHPETKEKMNGKLVVNEQGKVGFVKG
jgi:DNA topoisomerase-3